MKLRSNFYFNLKRNRCSGIVVHNDSSRIDLSIKVLKFLQENEPLSEGMLSKDKEDFSCAIYANQFRFRDINNILLQENFSLIMHQLWEMK